uniref:Steroid 5 alpha-reductase 1 n=1 Tax=Macaca mulatta TaxID=9544 RepID=A0A5F7ZJ74_MACMU
MATAVAEELLLAEERMLAALAYLQCAVGCAVLARNRETNLAYGRHASPSFRVRVPARAAWVVQELPSLALPLYQYASESAPRLRSAPNCILLAMFLVHYGHRFWLVVSGYVDKHPFRSYPKESQKTRRHWIQNTKGRLI